MAEQAAETTQEAQEATQNAESTTTTELTASESQTFGADYVKQLRAEAAKHRKEAQEAKTRIEEFELSQKSELEKAQTRAQKLEGEKQQAEAKLLRYEVATEKNVPAKLVPLLTATTREELEAQAALILESAKPESPDFDGGPREPAGPAKEPQDEHNDLVSQLLRGNH